MSGQTVFVLIGCDVTQERRDASSGPWEAILGVFSSRELAITEKNRIDAAYGYKPDFYFVKPVLLNSDCDNDQVPERLP